MATEAFIQKRDVSWDISVGGSTVQIRVLGSTDATPPLELVRQALERLTRVDDMEIPIGTITTMPPTGARSAYTNNLSAQVKQNYKP